jgi:hypothetical protein
VTSSENPESRDADKTAVITKPVLQGGADQGSKAKVADKAVPSNGAEKSAAPKVAEKAEPSKVPDGATVEISKSQAKAAAAAAATPAAAPAAPAKAAKAAEQSTAEPTAKPQSAPVVPTKVEPVPPAPSERPEGLDLVAAAPPPWQRVTSDAQYAEAQTVGYPTSETVTPVEPPPVEQPAYPAQDPDTIAVARPVPPDAAAAQAAGGNRTSVNLGSSSARPGAAAPSARRPGRGPRRASLQVKRVDPWSVLKLALVLSVALFFVWLVAIGVLYGVLNGMGVWDKINNTAQDLLSGSEQAGDPLISAGRVFGVAAIIGAVNIVLFTALATVSAFVYNVSADLAGGLELTLSERE